LSGDLGGIGDEMQLPQSYLGHLDHRLTVLLSFTIRRDLGVFAPDHGESLRRGDVYRTSQEGSAIMLRVLLEFLGLKSKEGNPPTLVEAGARASRLGIGDLAHIPAVFPSR